MVKNKKLKGLGFNAKARKGSNKDLYKELLIKQKENKSASESASALGEFVNTAPLVSRDEEELLLQSLQEDSKEKILDHELIKKLNMNSKKRKRFEKFMEKELKKDERRLFYDKLRQNTVKSSDLLLLSSKTMGKINTKKELLARSLKEERAGIAASNPDVHLVIERKTPIENYQDSSDEDDTMDEDESDDGGKSQNDPVMVGSSLIAQAFAKQPHTVQVVESTGFGGTKLVDHAAPAIDPLPSVGSALKTPVVPAPSLGSALKKPAVPAPSLGSALKRKESVIPSPVPKKTKVAAHKGIESSSDSASSSDSDSESSSASGTSDTESKPSQSSKTAQGAQGLWASDIVKGETSSSVSLPSSTLLPSQVPPKKVEVSAIAPPPKPPVTAAYYVQVNRTTDMQVARMSLPVVAEEQPIMEAIMANSVTILCGETGSGKTTQVPQFLYEAGFGDKKHPLFPGMIGVTQPRRVAAVSMAKRVAEEMNLLHGNDAGQVTYQVRYDKALVGSNTRIKFMTDGILLRELSSVAGSKNTIKSKVGSGDLLLSQYSCIIIDEAHERTVGTDILIGWLTRIVKLRNSGKIKGIGPLKLIIMSATLRVEDFTMNKTLFPTDGGSVGPPPVVKVDGRQHKVVIHYNKKTPELDYLSEAFKKVVKIHTKLPHGGVLVFVTGMQEVRVLCRKLERRFGSKKQQLTHSNEGNDSKGQEDWIKEASFYGADFDGEGVDDFDEALEEEDRDEEESDEEEEEEVHILPGSIENDDEDDQVGSSMSDEERGPVHILPLYSLLSTSDQMKVFQPPPDGARLIVVATNVAETSLTIPGIKYVVDSGKAKERRYDTQTGIQNFKVSWTSNASANQRAGRAGRVGPGHCYRLFSSAVFENYFEKHSRPEILRVPIEGVVLNMKAMGINQVVGFPFPTPPDLFQLQDAEKLLKNLEAVSSDSMKITGIGKLMAQFPLSPRYAKMLVVAAKQAPSVLLYVIFIVSGLSVGQIFHRDMEIIGDSKPKKLDENDDAEEDFEEDDCEKEERKKTRGAFFKTMQVFAGSTPSSDSLMILRAIGTYLAESNKRGTNSKSLEAFCLDHFLRPKAMDEVLKLIQQLVNIANSVFGLKLSLVSGVSPPSKKHESLLRQVILSGYIDCVARLDETIMSGHGKNAIPTYQTIWSTKNEHYIIHPSSCLYRERPAPKWLVFDELQGKQETYGPDGELLTLRSNSLDGTERKFLKGITVISETWLAKQAPAMVFNGKILEQPEPRYNTDTDQVQGFISPSFGSKMWPLPMCEKTLDDGKDACVWFAKSLLDGDVFFGSSKSKADNIFLALKPFLSSKPGIITKSWAHNQAKVSQLLLELGSRNIVSRKSLLDTWKSDTSFLLSSYLLWIPAEFHATLKKSWPPIEFSNNRLDMNHALVESVSLLVKQHKKMDTQDGKSS